LFTRQRSNDHSTTQVVKAFTSQRNLRGRCVLFGSPRAYLRGDRSEIQRENLKTDTDSESRQFSHTENSRVQSATEDFERVFDREECPGYKTVL
jgi:hypothetical protein